MKAGPRRQCKVRERSRVSPRDVLALSALAASTLVAGVAGADPLRLRGDALVQTRSPAPTGLLVLRGEDGKRFGETIVDAETVAWLGAFSGDDASVGDVLTLSVRARHAPTGSELRAGRMVVTMGAIRPTHVDGARGLVRAFGGTTLEAFAGAPVARRFDYRTFDFATGGRLGQSVGDAAAVGVSYAQRHNGASLADEEVGADVAVAPVPWLSLAGRSAMDLVSRGVTDALGSLSLTGQRTKAELFATHRSPGRLLPATSLFSVLGDYAATSAGTTLRLRAFPRLDLIASGMVQTQAKDVGGQGSGRVVLALDDDWNGSILLEGRRVTLGQARWSGVRTAAVIPLSRAYRLGTEIELVRPDDPRGRGSLWPWAFVSMSRRSASGLEFGVGVEASSGPDRREEVVALGRVSVEWDSLRGATR